MECNFFAENFNDPVDNLYKLWYIENGKNAKYTNNQEGNYVQLCNQKNPGGYHMVPA